MKGANSGGLGDGNPPAGSGAEHQPPANFLDLQANLEHSGALNVTLNKSYKTSAFFSEFVDKMNNNDKLGFKCSLTLRLQYLVTFVSVVTFCRFF